MKPFKNVYFEIVGYCNAKCPYCVTGSTSNKGKHISVSLFDKAIKRLCDNNIIELNTKIALYNWGEPFLYPELDNILNVINKYELKCAISTNASKIPAINSDEIKSISDIYISMPGFSQNSYDRIHKLNFNLIKDNITKLTYNLRSNNYKGTIVICYHVYQFNLEELQLCKEFAKNLEIAVYPYFAYLNDWKQMTDWIKDLTPKEKLQQMSEDLFCYYMRKSLDNVPANYYCPQLKYLSIDEEANIITCCSLPKDHPDYLCGNIITDDLNNTIKQMTRKSICNDCMKSGYPYIVNNVIKPDF